MSQVIAVWGPTGAPGRTTVAINLAAELADLGNNVLLVDADTYGGAIAPMLGIIDEAAGFAAACRLSDTSSFTAEELETLTHATAEIKVLTGITRTDRWPELTTERVRRVLELARQNYDAVVVDVGFNLETDEEITSDLFAARRNAATLSVLKEADYIVEVCRADAVGIARFIRAHDVLVESFPEPVRVVVANKVRSGLDAQGSMHAAATLSRFAGLHEVVELPEDAKALAAASSAETTLNMAATKSKLRKKLAELATTLNRPSAVTVPKLSRFSRSRMQGSHSEQSEQLRDSA